MNVRPRTCEEGKRWSSEELKCVEVVRTVDPELRGTEVVSCKPGYKFSLHNTHCILITPTICSDNRFAYSKKEGKCVVKPVHAWKFAHKCKRGEYASKYYGGNCLPQPRCPKGTYFNTFREECHYNRKGKKTVFLRPK